MAIVSGNYTPNNSVPMDTRTIVENEAGIKTIENPHEGLIVYVKDNDTLYKITEVNVVSEAGVEFVKVKAYKKVADEYIDENELGYYLDGKRFKYLTQEAYDALTDNDKNDESIVYCIIDADPDYYNKEEIDNKLAGLGGGESVNLDNYYTKGDIDNNYYTKTQVNRNLQDYVNMSALNTKLADYYTKAEVDALLEGIAAQLLSLQSQVIKLEDPTDPTE
jgi:hypothetical protein